MLKSMKLEKCGNTFFKNLSGGEKKRLSIAIELITNPKILFLDEPTSGLDSYTAYNVIKTLNELKKTNNCIILLSIHQPNSELFSLFDKIIIMKDGNNIFSGSINQCSSYFDSIHLPIPKSYNPADFILFKLQTTSNAVFSTNRNYVNTSIKRVTINNNCKIIKHSKSFLKQTYYLSQREFKKTIRDKDTLITRFGISTLLNILFGLIFMGSGNSGDLTTYFGALVQIAISSMFSSTQPTLLSFPIERPIFIREYFTGTYKLFPYFISKLIIELPITFLLSLSTILIRYWLMDLKGNFIFLVFIIWLLGLVSSSISLFLGSITKNIKVALELSPIIFVPQIMFTGFFIKINQIPICLRWVQYLCSLKFAINLLMINEFSECQGFQEDCDKLLKINDVDKSLWWLYLLILLALFLIFRLLSLFSLSNLSKTF
jgi:energy-coupling factor transporter ATP-binding protein EcfA2